MNIYTNNKFKGCYPVGTAAVVVANNAIHAACLLAEELERLGLDSSRVEVYDMRIVDDGHAHVRILNDGNY